jgi:predicted O-methyltransferase YrrM
MREIGHWTPRYVVNRVAWFMYERRNMDKPWLTPGATELLAELLLPSDTGLEWGSGRSTVWFAKRLKHLTSIEDNREWYKTVTKRLSEQNVTNVSYHHAPAPPEGEGARQSPYVAICSSVPDRSLGFALVDGSAREYCTTAVIPKIAPGGLLVIDNANWFFDHPTHSPGSRMGKGPKNATWAEAAATLSNWRSIWTTQGISDTGIWIRPASA